MSKRRFRPESLIIGTLIVICMGMAYGWQRTSSAERSRRAARRAAVQAEMSKGATLVQMTTGGGPGSGRTIRESRMFSTLATLTGPYIFSVRQVVARDYFRHMLEPYFPDRRPTTQVQVVFQVLLPRNETGSRFELDYSTVRATEDTGRPLINAETPDDERTPQEGIGCIFLRTTFEPATSVANSIDVLEGTLVAHGPDKKTTRYPFKIKDIPLPTGPRVYARAIMRLVDDSLADSITDGAVVLRGDKLEDMLPMLLPDPVGKYLPDQRLIFAEENRVFVPVPSPGSTQGFHVRVSTGKMESILLQIEGGGRSWTGTVWDTDPLLVILPKRAGKPRSAAVLRFARQFEPYNVPGGSPPIYPPAPGTMGGFVEGRILVDGQPFGAGYITISLSRKLEEGWDTPRLVGAAFNSAGKLTLPNLAPGVYRVDRRLGSLRPYSGLTGKSPTVQSYMRSRFGVHTGKWTGDKPQEFEVKDGQVTRLVPLEWKSDRGMLEAAVPSDAHSE